MKESPLLKQNSEIQLVDCAGNVDQIAQARDGVLAITREQSGGVRRFPSAARRNPSRRGDVMHRDNGLQTMFVASREHSAVVLELSLRKAAFLGLDASPFDRETVGIEAKVGEKCYVVGVTVIVIAGVTRGFHVKRAVDVLEKPRITVRVATFYLMRCSR
jgi:hypothetical protein